MKRTDCQKGYLLGVLLLFVSMPSVAVGLNDVTAIYGPIDKLALVRVRDLLNVPEEEVNFTRAKLTIDQIIDPEINIFREMMRLDRMVDDINQIGPLSTSLQKLNALRKYLYDAGSWNHYIPFVYDLADPKGTIIENKLLANYLDSRKGNCISMPFLFIVLGQKLDIDVVASTAPLHVFVKFTDRETGKTYNVETTSGGRPARDSWLRQGFPMTDLAISSGIYLQKLSKQETVAVMAQTLLQHYMEEEQFGQVILVAELILSIYDRSISAILYKSSAFNELVKVHELWQYHSPSEVPENKRELFKYLISQVNGHHREAVRLGWHPPTQEENDEYLSRIRQANSN